MKKSFKILCIVILILLILAAVVTLVLRDLTSIRETPLEKASKIAKERTQNKIAGDFYLFSIDDYDKSLVITRYGAMDVISIKYVFELENDIVQSVLVEEHFDSKLTAIMYDRNYTNRKINGNIVTGVLNAEDIIGLSKDEVIQKFRTSYINIGMYELYV